MKSSTKTRHASSPLPQALHDRLNAYALAASAAGVAVLAASPAQAKVIYTPLNVNIAPHHSLPIDLNHDGIADFVIQNKEFRSIDIWGNTLLAKPLVASNAIAGIKGVVNTLYASAFKSGSPIGPSQHFSGKILAASGMEYGYIGQWQNVTNLYLGLKFHIKGHEHFGWARLTVSSGTGTGITATLTGFAYETQAGKPIIAGSTTAEMKTLGSREPLHGPLDQYAANAAPRATVATLGLLAAGAPALPIWKRDRIDTQ